MECPWPITCLTYAERFHMDESSVNRREVSVSWKPNILVIANLTLGSDALLDTMRAEAAQGQARFTLVMPQRAPHSAAYDTAPCPPRRAVERFSQAGLNVSVRPGHSDPVIAAVENYDPQQFDKIIVCTLPARVSRWLRSGVPARIRRITGAPVTHLETVDELTAASASRPVGPIRAEAIAA